MTICRNTDVKSLLFCVCAFRTSLINGNRQLSNFPTVSQKRLDRFLISSKATNGDQLKALFRPSGKSNEVYYIVIHSHSFPQLLY